ncbi:hypothetical protein NMD10_27720 (plasmid) [Citrobacter portucalensis]|uniref:hypothetical protein n=1 Tax=Citrobacter portucalensis TaxID=1639133 RepID=UPI00351CE9CA
MTTPILYTLPGAVQARRIARHAVAAHDHRRWRIAMRLMRRSMLIHAIAREACDAIQN